MLPWQSLTALLRRLPPETAHRLSISALKAGLYPRAKTPDPRLATRLWGKDFATPIGLAAGYDKGAEAPGALLRMGFSFVEIGTVTPKPQPGNPRPRLFRLPVNEAVINRLGFNSEGLDVVAARLKQLGKLPGLLGVNVGKNRDSEDAAADYVAGAKRLAPFADYVVINVSSPNTPGLRELQRREALADLIGKVRAALPDPAPPLVVKIAPDLNKDERADIAAVVLHSHVDGVIIGNTTLRRPPYLRGRHRAEAGGLSGRPLFDLSTEVLADLYQRTNGMVPLIGAGGVSSGADAYAKIRAGASLVQLYTGLVYGGPRLAAAIAAELAQLLARDGFAHVGDAVGAAHRSRSH